MGQATSDGAPAGGGLLSPKAAAARVNVSVSLIYRWCTDGSLTHLRVGAKGRRGKILIAPTDLDALLATFRIEGRVGLPREPHHPSTSRASVPRVSGFSELDPGRLARAWSKR
ncbi:helix-turn-helix domain-containing protein [Gemmata sp.]|uniref:helix-turn-helix domain-containing protein n=1 Tax=Gemmata sp. TaxID=1914242 RepID=UPI003F72CB42